MIEAHNPHIQTNSKTSMLSVHDLHVVYQPPKNAPEQTILDRINFDVHTNELLSVVGPSGAGKSTLALALTQSLSSSLRVKSGSVLFQGQQISQKPRSEVAHLWGQEIGMIFQDPTRALAPQLTIGAHFYELFLAHQAVRTQSESNIRAKDVLYDVGISSPKRYLGLHPRAISVGTLQRIMIALAIAMKPSLVVADEPITALDMVAQMQVIELLRGLQKKRKMSMLWIAHDFGLVQSAADRVLVLSKGRVAEEGTPKMLFSSPQHSETQKLVRAIPRIAKAPERLASSFPLAHGVSGVHAFSDANRRRSKKPILHARNLSHTFLPWWKQKWGRLQKEDYQLYNISFDVYPGETLAFVGEAGSGRSLMARCISGLLKSTFGAVEYFAHSEASQEEAKPCSAKDVNVQIIAQHTNHSLNPSKNIAQIIAQGLQIRGEKIDAVEFFTRRALAKVGLPSSILQRYPSELSIGEQQRVAIARAMVVRPRLIIADEALSALDGVAQMHIISLLRRLQIRTKLGVIFITHDLRSAYYGADRIAVLHQGEIIETGSVKSIFEHPKHPYTQRLIESIPKID